MTYPISPDYVKSWTPVRAICEWIANALDEDPAAVVSYDVAAGELSITDQGAGIPEEGLILGYSPKGDTEIGQFGEGAKIASLVLARSPEVGRVLVETVGYGFEPHVESRAILDGIAPRRGSEPPQVLVYEFLESARTRGTRARIECPEPMAREAIGRFRHLSEPGYVPPVGTVDILTGGTPGRLFIGGVLVSEMPRMVASYDFPLARAKAAQNRDRTVIDADQLVGLVRGALAECAEEQVVRHVVGHALEGGKLVEAERYFDQITDPRVRATFRRVGDSLFAGRNVFYSYRNSTEADLYLLDGDFEVLTTSLDQTSHYALMSLLGVKTAPRAQQDNATQAARRTKYLPLSRLTVKERDVLAAATAQVEGLFGPLGEVKVYAETSDPAMACAQGFYSPATGAISVSRPVLASQSDTVEVLVHELGHRLAHRQGGQYMDRTRGFEDMLTRMLATAVAAYAAQPSPVSAAGGAAPEDGPAEAAAALARGPEVPAARTALAGLLNDLLPRVMGQVGGTGIGQVSEAMAMHPTYLPLLLKPHPAGWRRSTASQRASVVGDVRKHQVIGETFGVRPAVVWLGHLLPEGPAFGRRGGKVVAGPWVPRLRRDADLVAAELRGYGGVYSDAADRLLALAEGSEDATGPVDGWSGFVVDVVAAERQRLGLPELDASVAAAG